MRIEIEIPKEFEEHFKQDRFEDSLNRLLADANLIAGRYERELAEMLIKSFKESKPGYNQDKVVKELKKIEEHCLEMNDWQGQSAVVDAIESVKHGGVTEDVCEWKLTDTQKLMPYKTYCGNEDLYDSHYKYCPYCGKKIKVVE